MARPPVGVALELQRPATGRISGIAFYNGQVRIRAGPAGETRVHRQLGAGTLVEMRGSGRVQR